MINIQAVQVCLFAQLYRSITGAVFFIITAIAPCNFVGLPNPCCRSVNHSFQCMVKKHGLFFNGIDKNKATGGLR